VAADIDMLPFPSHAEKIIWIHPQEGGIQEVQQEVVERRNPIAHHASALRSSGEKPITAHRREWRRSPSCTACASRYQPPSQAGSVIASVDGFFLYYPSRRHIRAPLRAFIDFLRKEANVKPHFTREAAGHVR
jgi:hypothetical protein